VGSVLVVEGLVFGQDTAEVVEVPDESPIEEFGADGSVPALLDRVHDRACTAVFTISMPTA
jgi:hypothetical protein